MKHIRACAMLLACLVAVSCGGTATMPEIIALHEGWTFSRVGEDVWRSASVPGTVHQDLMAHGLIPNPFVGTNEKDVQWVEREDWDYRTSFDVSREQLERGGAVLTFDGLDTYADVWLNDSLVLKGDNMFVGYDIPVKDLLRIGENDLRIRFHSPIKLTRPLSVAAGFEYPADNEPVKNRLSVYSRKAPFHYGWDWGIRLVTGGVWRDAKLTFYDHVRITDFFVRQDNVTPKTAKVVCEIAVDAIADCRVTVAVESCRETEKHEVKRIVDLKRGENRLKLPLQIENPDLWMPNGMGEAARYDFGVSLSKADDNEKIAEKRHRIGLRNIEVVTEKDSLGESFYFKVNGVPVYAKGANYIPLDPLLPRVTSARYARLFDDIKRSNMNMVRVWGGGVYEDDYFYELADSLGILVWQDFMFACTPYPSDTLFLKNVEREAEYNIKRLRNHASLAMWCGNNEVLEALKYWGFARRYDSEVMKGFFASYDTLFRSLLPEKVDELDAGRFYVHGSPYEANWGRTELFAIRDAHDWGVWQGGLPFEAFAERIPRFASEFGFQSFPEMKTIRTFADTADYAMDSEVMRAHQKSYVGSKVIADYVARYYREPQTFEDFVYLSQVMQGMGVRMGIEAQRRARPYCMGTLYWQMNDCWPVVSWSGTDAYGNWKALQHQVQRAFASPALSIAEVDGKLQYHILSDELLETAAVCRTTLIDFSGNVMRQTVDSLTVPANASVCFAVKERNDWGVRPENSCLHLQLENLKGECLYEYIYYFCLPKQLRLPVPDVEVSAAFEEGACMLTLQSDVIVKDVFIETPWQGASYSDNFFDLLPGEVKRVEISSPLITSEAACDSCISLIYLNKFSKP